MNVPGVSAQLWPDVEHGDEARAGGLLPLLPLIILLLGSVWVDNGSEHIRRHRHLVRAGESARDEVIGPVGGFHV